MALTVAGLFGLHRADQLYGPSGQFERQLVWVVLAWSAMFAVAWFPWRRLRHFSGLLFAVCQVLLVIVLFMPPVNGSRRWIPLGPVDFQPSEPARLTFIMALASWLMYRDNLRTVRGLIVPFLLTLMPLLLILREPDLGTALLFLPILYCMLFAAGARGRHLTAAAAAGICLLPLLWQQMTAEQRSRVVALFQQTDGGPTPTDDRFHLHQSKQILALGGLQGSLFRQEREIDDPAAWRLPAARTDFVLSLIGERYGLAGIATVLMLYLVLAGKGLQAARATRDPWGRLVATGIVAMIGVQALINSAMTVGLMPITGMTLPFCSYGGSSLLSFSVAVGLLISIARQPGYDVGPSLAGPAGH